MKTSRWLNAAPASLTSTSFGPGLGVGTVLTSAGCQTWPGLPAQCQRVGGEDRTLGFREDQRVHLSWRRHVGVAVGHVLTSAAVAGSRR